MNEKIITIHQNGSIPITICDKNDDDLESYSHQLSPIFDNNNISIITTSESSVVIRPSKIISIVVEERNKKVHFIPKNPQLKKSENKQTKQTETKKKAVIKDDYVLTD